MRSIATKRRRFMLSAALALLLLPVLGGCTRWPRVEIMGDSYYLSPFQQDRDITARTRGSGGAAASTGVPAQP